MQLAQEVYPLELTRWGELLFSTAVRYLQPGSEVVDLGAGKDAVIARALLARQPNLKIYAIEPNVAVSAPSEIGIYKGEITLLSESSVDAILFNPPATPDGLLDQADPRYFSFAGGPTGGDVIQKVVTQASSRLRHTGQMIFICPTHRTFRAPQGFEISVLGWDFEPIEPLVERTPVLNGMKIQTKRHIEESLELARQFWEPFSPPKHAGAIGLAAVCLRR